MADEVGVERRGPRDAALEEREVHVREPVRHPAEEQRLRQRVLTLGERAEMVVHVARDRAARAEPDEARVEGDRDAELLGGRPDRVVVVGAVDAELIEPRRPPRQLRLRRGRRVDRALHVSGAQHRLEAEHVDRVLELGHGFVGRVHRDRRHRREPVGERGEGLGVAAVERAARAAARVVLPRVEEHEPEARVHDAEVEARARRAARRAGPGTTQSPSRGCCGPASSTTAPGRRARGPAPRPSSRANRGRARGRAGAGGRARDARARAPRARGRARAPGSTRRHDRRCR